MPLLIYRYQLFFIEFSVMNDFGYVLYEWQARKEETVIYSDE